LNVLSKILGLNDITLSSFMSGECSWVAEYITGKIHMYEEKNLTNEARSKCSKCNCDGVPKEVFIRILERNIKLLENPLNFEINPSKLYLDNSI